MERRSDEPDEEPSEPHSQSIAFIVGAFEPADNVIVRNQWYGRRFDTAAFKGVYRIDFVARLEAVVVDVRLVYPAGDPVRRAGATTPVSHFPGGGT